MIHKEIFHSVGLFDESFVVCEDFDMWLRVAYRFDIGFCDDILTTKIAGHKGQLSFENKNHHLWQIKSLKKFINSRYKKEVKEKILKKGGIV